MARLNPDIQETVEQKNIELQFATLGYGMTKFFFFSVVYFNIYICHKAQEEVSKRKQKILLLRHIIIRNKLFSAQLYERRRDENYELLST